MRILLAGATGLVGNLVLQLLLADACCGTLVAPTRRALTISHRKLDNPVLDFDDLRTAAAAWQVDAAICALGTTIKLAGSQEGFRRVDHDYPLWLAQALREGGTGAFVLNSSTGADPASRVFYLRVKGELERDLRALGFDALTLVRPGFIGGERAVPRPAERVTLAALRVLGPVLPRRWRVNPAPVIARAMTEAAFQHRPGVHVIESAELAG